MIRKQAAILAANAWKQNNQSNLDDDVAEGQSRWNEDTQSSGSPSSRSLFLYSKLESWSHAKANQSQFLGSASFATTPANSTDPSHFPNADTWNQQQASFSSWDPPSRPAGTNNISCWTGLGPVNNPDHVSTGITPCSPMSAGPAHSSDLDASSSQFCPVYSDALHAIDTLHGQLAQTSEPTALDLFCLRHLQERFKGGAPLDGWYRYSHS